MKDILDLLEDLIEAYDALENEGIGPSPSIEDYEAIALHLEAGGRNADDVWIRRDTLIGLALRNERWESHRAGWAEQGYLDVYTACSICGRSPLDFWKYYCSSTV